MGYRERINLLAWLLSTGEAFPDNAKYVFAEHMKHATYDHNTDEITTSNGTVIGCEPAHRLLDEVVWPMIPNTDIHDWISE